MSEASSVEAILSLVREHEKEYDWIGAAESCEKILGLMSGHDFSRVGEVYERMGYAFYRACYAG